MTGLNPSFSKDFGTFNFPETRGGFGSFERAKDIFKDFFKEDFGSRGYKFSYYIVIDNVF